ncbi:MAG: hypothetical protein K0S27_933 [Gammaproteobacteria bacterium]|jgi:hypothetical protein|nr:hypothetical protein [Gammaproteobacteria bacterium]
MRSREASETEEEYSDLEPVFLEERQISPQISPHLLKYKKCVNEILGNIHSKDELEGLVQYVQKIEMMPFNYDQYGNHFFSLQLHFSSSSAKISFLKLGFRAAYENLVYFINNEAKALTIFDESLKDMALLIASEERIEFHNNHYDNEKMLHRIERLYRIRIALEQPDNNDNNNKLARLVKDSTHFQSYGRFFLGLMMLMASIVVVLATHGVAIPYLTKILADTTLAINASTLAGMVGASGIGMMVWEKKSHDTSATGIFCHFWNQREKRRKAGETLESSVPSSQLSIGRAPS